MKPWRKETSFAAQQTRPVPSLVICERIVPGGQPDISDKAMAGPSLGNLLQTSLRGTCAMLLREPLQCLL